MRGTLQKPVLRMDLVAVLYEAARVAAAQTLKNRRGLDRGELGMAEASNGGAGHSTPSLDCGEGSR